MSASKKKPEVVDRRAVGVFPLRVESVARRLGLSVAEVTREIEKGPLKGWKDRGEWRVFPAHLREYAALRGLGGVA